MCVGSAGTGGTRAGRSTTALRSWCFLREGAGIEPRGPQEFTDAYSRSLPPWLLLELSDPDPLPAWECSALKGQCSRKQRNVIPPFFISLCHRRRQSLGREEVVLESWIGDFRGKKKWEFSHPRVPLQPQGRTRNAGAPNHWNPFVLFLEKWQSWSPTTKPRCDPHPCITWGIPSFQRGVIAKISFPGKNLRDFMCTFPWISSTKHNWNIWSSHF